MLTVVPGIPESTKGPFFCHNASLAPTDIRQCCDRVDESIRTEGPFDGILGFSLGASLVMSYLLQREIEGRYTPLKFAILFSSVLSFSPDETFGSDCLANLSDREIQLLDSYPKSDLSSLHPLTRALCETATAGIYKTKMGGFLPRDSPGCCFSLRNDPSQPRVFHPALLKSRVSIPTVHITGRRDHPVITDMSLSIQELCDMRLVRSASHSGGHDVPRQPDDVRAAWAAIEWAIEQSQKLHNM